MTLSHRQRIEQAQARVAERQLQLRLAEQERDQAIVDALEAGATYRSVGHMLGVQGSTVFRRYGAKNTNSDGDVLDQEAVPRA